MIQNYCIWILRTVIPLLSYSLMIAQSQRQSVSTVPQNSLLNDISHLVICRMFYLLGFQQLASHGTVLLVWRFPSAATH